MPRTAKKFPLFRASAARLLVPAACAVAALLPAPARGQDADWDAAVALKKQSAYVQAARAFEAWAQKNPTAQRAGEALTEAGVCWFSEGRSKLVLLRKSEASDAAFRSALGSFDRVLQGEAALFKPRAQYMRGSTRFFMDDMPAAEIEYSLVVDKWKDDAKYLAKALEKRAAVRRNRLDTRGALADLTRYATEFPAGDDIKSVNQYIARVQGFGKPAPVIDAQAWIQGGPLSIASSKGDLVVLYFFASWCENCEAIRPFVQDVFDRYESFGLKWIGVMDGQKGQTAESVRPWLLERKYRFPVVMTGGAAARAYGATSIPALVLIDRAGRVRWNDNPNNLMDSTIEMLLAEDPAAKPGK